MFHGSYEPYPGRDLIPSWCGKPFKRQRPRRMWRGVRVWLFVIKGFFNTPNWNTPRKKTCTKRLKRGISFILWFGGLPGVCDIGCVETTFDCCGCGCLVLVALLVEYSPNFHERNPKMLASEEESPFFEEFIFIFFCEDLGNQWICLVIGGRDYITPLMAIYHIYLVYKQYTMPL